MAEFAFSLQAAAAALVGLLVCLMERPVHMAAAMAHITMLVVFAIEAVEEAAQFASSGPVLHAPSRQLARATHNLWGNDETLYTG